MTKYKIHNGSFRTKAFKVRGGTEDVLPGKTATIDVQGGLTPEFITAQTALGVKFEEVKGKEAPKSSEGYTVLDKGRGWFAITKDGKEVTKSLREDDVAGFDALSAEDKAAFVELHKGE